MNWLTDLLKISSKNPRKDVSKLNSYSVVSTDYDDYNFSKSSNEKGKLEDGKDNISIKFADKVRNEKNNNNNQSTARG